MNRAKLIIAGFAILAAVLIGLFAASMLEPEPVPVAQAPEAPVVPQIQQSDVLVATRELGPSRALTETDMAWMAFPDTTIAPSMILKKTTPDAIMQNIGKIPSQTISAGEPIRQERLNAAMAGGVLATLLKPGMRAYTITVDDKLSIPGFIVPRDIVDVMALERWDNNRKGAQLLIKSVKILAIGSKTDTTKGPDERARTATLEVTPTEMELLGKLEMTGVRLVLVPMPIDEGRASQEDRSSYPTIVFQKRLL